MTITSPTDKKKFFDAIVEISNSLLRIEAERDLIRETVKELSAEHQVPKKTINKIAKTYHKQNLTQEVLAHEEFVELYDSVTK
jgi:regulator of replication initiation timing